MQPLDYTNTELMHKPKTFLVSPRGATLVREGVAYMGLRADPLECKS